jgi:hypothetical protein
MKRVTLKLKLLGVLVFLAALNGLSAANEPTAAATAVPFERIPAQLTLTTEGNEFLVIRTEAELKRMWETHTRSTYSNPAYMSAPNLPGPAPQPPPQVDFNKSVLVAFLGGFSACEPYRITRVLELPDRITVEVTHQEAGSGCVCTTNFAPSIEIARIPRTNKPISYVVETDHTECR